MALESLQLRGRALRSMDGECVEIGHLSSNPFAERVTAVFDPLRKFQSFAGVAGAANAG